MTPRVGLYDEWPARGRKEVSGGEKEFLPFFKGVFLSGGPKVGVRLYQVSFTGERKREREVD